MWRVGFLGKRRYEIEDLNSGCSQGCHWERYVFFFYFFHFLTIVVSYLNEQWMTWWFKHIQFTW
jgi:phosphate starvation-inducible membrane PsiE